MADETHMHNYTEVPTTILQFIENIKVSKCRLKDQAVKMLLGVNDESSLKDIAAVFETVSVITDPSVISQYVKDGQTASLPAGYYPQGAEVIGSDESGSYILTEIGAFLVENGVPGYTENSSEYVPTESDMIFAPTEYGFKGFTVKAIPDNYRNVLDIDESLEAAADQVLVGRQFIDRTLRQGSGYNAPVTGTMADNSGWGASGDVKVGNGIDATIPKGYHDGTGKVTIDVEELTEITPLEQTQSFTAANGKVFTQVNVAAIDEKYMDASKVNLDEVESNMLLTGKTAIGNRVEEDGSTTAVKVIGTMANLGDKEIVLNASKLSDSTTIADGYVKSLTVTADAEALDVTVNKATSVIKSDTGKLITEVAVTLDTQDKEVGPLAPGAADLEVVADGNKILNKVTVKALDASYVSVTETTETPEADKILAGTKVYAKDAEGKPALVVGTMANNGAQAGELGVGETFSIPTGYTDGGEVTVKAEAVTVTFDDILEGEDIDAVTGAAYFNKVDIDGTIPGNWTNVDAAAVAPEADKILTGTVVYAKDAEGNAIQVTGTMLDRSATQMTINGLTEESYTLEAGYYAEGTTISLTDDIKEALASI